jgi:hypothetical protein
METLTIRRICEIDRGQASPPTADEARALAREVLRLREQIRAARLHAFGALVACRQAIPDEVEP